MCGVSVCRRILPLGSVFTRCTFGCTRSNVCVDLPQSGWNTWTLQFFSFCLAKQLKPCQVVLRNKELFSNPSTNSRLDRDLGFHSAPQNLHFVVFQELPWCFCCMFGVVVLLESKSQRQIKLQVFCRMSQMILQKLLIFFFIHLSLHHYRPSRTSCCLLVYVWCDWCLVLSKPIFQSDGQQSQFLPHQTKEPPFS